MNVEDVITEARDITEEESYDDLWMVKRINIGLKEVAAVLAIPGLSDSDTVTAVSTSDHAALPDNFSHDLYLATTETYPNGLILCENLKSLLRIMTRMKGACSVWSTVQYKDLYYASGCGRG
jgi:hypothetical protein